MHKKQNTKTRQFPVCATPSEAVAGRLLQISLSSRSVAQCLQACLFANAFISS